MKYLIFQFIVGNFFSLLILTRVWGLFNLESPLFIPPITASSSSEDIIQSSNDEEVEIPELELPESVLANLDTIEFEYPELVNICVDQIERYCKQTGISLRKILSVIENFDTFLGINAGGLVAKGISPHQQALIKILSEEDAVDFANMMIEITNNILQNFGVYAFDDKNELLNPNLTIQSYTLPLGNIIRNNPEVKGSNILLGALDFILNSKELDNIEGINGYNIFNPYDGLVVALGNFAQSKEIWLEYYDYSPHTPTYPLCGYQSLLSGFDAALGELKAKATVKDASEMIDFAELIHVATIAYNKVLAPYNNPSGPVTSPPTILDFWKQILNQAIEQGMTEFSEISYLIKQMYEIQQ